MQRETFYITTPIYYVNDLPHIGHIYTTVVADAIARFQRMLGRDVRFLTGTDEHGQKIDRSARDQGIAPKELADRVVSRYHELWRQLQITHDDFIRTTEPRHHAGVRELISRLQARGDIYRDAYEGWYCAGCEAFYPESQLVEGRCPDQGHAVEKLREESYFFRLSAYQEPLLRHYREHPDFIRPTSRYNEVVRFVEGGLKDLSISRTSLTWGIPYPGDERHVVYVWLDALTNYVSALGFGSGEAANYDRFWPADLHLVGKDILRFHCVYWPAFLMSAGVPLPKQVVGHGWWLRDEKKMSKSLGNVVRPDELLARFGSDPLRYFLLREMTFGQDASFSDEGFLTRYNADLANGLGNSAARVTAMARRYFAGRTPGVPCGDSVIRARAEEVTARYRGAMEGLEFHRALEAAWELLAAVDAYVNDRAPWSVARAEGTDSERLQRILYNCLEAVRLVAVMVSPIMPDTSMRLMELLGVTSDAPGSASLHWGELETDQPLGSQMTLFPRVDLTEYFSEEAKMDKSGGGTPDAGVPTHGVGALDRERADDQVSIDEFARIKLVVGLIRHAERVPKSKKLIRMEVDLGDASLRQIVAGIGTRYEPDNLLNRRAVFVANLKPATLMGVESRGMVLAATVDGEPILLGVDADVPPGTPIK